MLPSENYALFEDLKPLGSSVLVTNERVFLTVGILELFFLHQNINYCISIVSNIVIESLLEINEIRFTSDPSVTGFAVFQHHLSIVFEKLYISQITQRF